jgi:hypothetical protein
VKRLGQLSLADPVRPGQQAQAENLSVMGVGIAHAPLHRLPVQMKHPPKGLECAQRGGIEVAVAG